MALGFKAFVAWRRPGGVNAWTPWLRAEAWASYARHCDDLLKAADAPRIFSSVDLESLSVDLPKGYRLLAEEMLKLFAEPKLMAVGGGRGTGKTALVTGLIVKFCQAGRPAIYRTAKGYLDGVTEAPWEQKDQWRRRHAAVDLLVLDEIQVRDEGRQRQDNELAELIDARHRDGRSTLLVSNLTSDALRDNLGDSIWRRLVETGGLPIVTNWTRIVEHLNEVRRVKAVEAVKRAQAQGMAHA